MNNLGQDAYADNLHCKTINITNPIPAGTIECQELIVGDTANITNQLTIIGNQSTGGTSTFNGKVNCYNSVELYNQTTGGNTNGFIMYADNNNLAFQYNADSTDKMILDSSGNLGVHNGIASASLNTNSITCNGSASFGNNITITPYAYLKGIVNTPPNISGSYSSPNVVQKSSGASWYGIAITTPYLNWSRYVYYGKIDTSAGNASAILFSVFNYSPAYQYNNCTAKYYFTWLNYADVFPNILEITGQSGAQQQNGALTFSNFDRFYQFSGNIPNNSPFLIEVVFESINP